VLQGKDVTKPLIEDKALSDLYDKYAEEYKSSIASNKEGFAHQANVHYLDMTEVESKNVLPILLERHKGKVVMIDIWVTKRKLDLHNGRFPRCGNHQGGIRESMEKISKPF
jgi:hypothetical protein